MSELIRAQPYKPTKLGEYLIGHYKQVSLLEDSFKQRMEPETRATISIALNRDSLETWFLDLDIDPEINVEIITADQEHTLDLFRKGLVSACISTSEKAIPGSDVTFLGTMDYVLVASPAFAKKHFSKKGSYADAPALKYDQNDVLHERYLEKFFNIPRHDLQFHTIPSVRGFKTYVLKGYAYGLLPHIDIAKEIKDKKLILLESKKKWEVPLYWHSWNIKSLPYQKLNNIIIKHAKNKLFLNDL